MEVQHTDNVNNKEACTDPCARGLVGYGLWAVGNIRRLGRPPPVPFSLGKGHFYLLHVRQNLCQRPKTPPQI